ncbi:MAG: hypothetical protein FWG65_00895 [Turicibacter sp.]|nr:hypothetical protein [Turicibacter sp.]
MEILMFFAQVISRLLLPAVSLVFAVIFLKGNNWVSFPHIGLEQKQRLQEEYDFVQINRHFIAPFFLLQAVWIGATQLTSLMNNPLYWLTYGTLGVWVLWVVSISFYIYVMLTKRFCDRFRRTAQTEQI